MSGPNSVTAPDAAVRYARQEDHRLITGQGRFTADHRYPGMLHASVIRSPHAHARIVRIDLSAVRQAPGVRYVMAAEELAALGGRDLPNAQTFPGKGGQAQVIVTLPVFARDTV